MQYKVPCFLKLFFSLLKNSNLAEEKFYHKNTKTQKITKKILFPAFVVLKYF